MKRTNILLTLAGIVLGAVGGYLYYHYIGCNTGTCPITSKPLNSTLYGALLGAFLFNTFTGNKHKQHEGLLG